MKRILLLLAAAGVLLALPLVSGAHHRPGHQGGGPLSIAADPASVVFGRTTTIRGRLTDNPNAGIGIELQQRAEPSGSFSRVASTTTASNGSYSFTGVKPLLNTRYRVVAGTSPPRTSAEVIVPVAIRVSFRVSDSTPRARSLVRFSGGAAPQHDGALVSIQRRTSSGYRTVARTRLRDAGDARSRYSRRVRISRDGTFRVVVAGDADHVRGTSRRRNIDVH